MKRPTAYFFGALAISLAGTFGPLEARANEQGATDIFEEALLDGLRRGVSQEDYVARILSPLGSLDRENDGLDQSDIDREETRRRTQHRANIVGGLLQYDFDGDLRVTFDEIVAFSDGPPERREKAAQAAMRRFDEDDDGKVTIEEALANLPQQRVRKAFDTAALLTFDTDHDGRVTADELKQQALVAFRAFDTDGDAIISQDEEQVVQTEKRLAAKIREMRQKGCFFEPPSKDAIFVAYAPQSGQTTSNVFVGNSGLATEVIDIKVEAGKTPVYLLLYSSHSMIWRVTGATSRVERIVTSAFRSNLSGQNDETRTSSAVGVVGVDRSTVTITTPDCVPRFIFQRDIDTGVPQAEIAALFGRAPDRIQRENPIASVSVPSLEFVRLGGDPLPPAPAGFDTVIWKDAVEFSPGGLASIRAENVVADEPVGYFEVLPNFFGVSKLVGSGHLSYEGTAFYSRKLFIEKPFAHWPAGLNGALSASFVLRDGISMPEGKLGHSCVLNEEEGAKPNWAEICRDKSIPMVPPPVIPSPPRIRRNP